MSVPEMPKNVRLRLPLVNGALGKCRSGTYVRARDGWRPDLNHGMTGSMDKNIGRAPSGGGAIIALLTMAGVFIGGFMGQPSIGFLVGLGSGILIAIMRWLRERNR